MTAHKGTLDTITDTLTRRGEELGERIEMLEDGARGMVERTRERAHAVGDELSTYIQRQPVKSVLIAAGVGLLFGAIFRHR